MLEIEDYISRKSSVSMSFNFLKFPTNKIFIQLFIQYFLCMNMTIKWESLLGFLKVGSIHSY